MTSALAPFVGFGDDQNTSIKFQVIHDRGKLADWSSPAKIASLNMANGSQTVTQRIGRESWEITLRLLFDSVAELELMDAMQGYESTLRYLWGVTKAAGGTKKTILNTDYLILPDTLLARLDKEAIHYRSGQCVVQATFRRPYVESAYVGFTLLTPEGA